MRTMTFVILALAVSSIFCQNAAASEENLVLYFKFDEIDDDGFLVDHSGMGNRGKVIGVNELVDGKFGQSIKMDGSAANYVEVADADSLDLTDVYTLAIWVNFAQITGDRHQFFFDKGADDKAPGGWRLGKLKSGDLRFQVFKNGAWEVGFDLLFPKFVPDEWYHTAVTRDETGMATIYLNGEAGATRAGDSCLLPKNTNTLTVWGSTGFGAGNMFTGALDELAIFNGRALSQNEIQYLMETGTFAVEPAGKLIVTWANLKNGI